jgi:predicted NAD/FAD-dependent oxidoreductase
MNNMYDLVCIGAGPAGLALAQMCCKVKGLKILLVDKENDCGGAHRVRRVYVPQLGENMFTQHAPVVYGGSTYITFQKLLKEMKTDFYDLFTKYNFNITEIGGSTIFSVLSFGEISSFILPFLFLVFNDEYGDDIVLHNFIKNFSKDSIEMIDRICVLTDGGDSTKFTLNKFLQLLNQQFLYPLYQPKLPNDIGLFKIWKDYLTNSDVEILLNTNIEKVNIVDNLIESINIRDNKKIYAKNFVFAIPPKNLNEIVKKNNIKFDNNDINLDQYAQDTAYYDYISFTFHWNKTLDLKRVYGFPASDWGIAFIKLSDYTTFKEQNSKTVLSLALTRSEKVSKNIGKTANQCTFNEIVDQVYLELKVLYGENFEYPTIALLSPGVKYDDILKKWISYDTAFINSANYESLNFKNNTVNNMYNLGTHNGKSLYKFTSLESAVSNAVYLSKILYPELTHDHDTIQIDKSITLTQIIFAFLVFSNFLAFLVFLGRFRNKK